MYDEDQRQQDLTDRRRAALRGGLNKKFESQNEHTKAAYKYPREQWLVNMYNLLIDIWMVS